MAIPGSLIDFAVEPGMLVSGDLLSALEAEKVTLHGPTMNSICPAEYKEIKEYDAFHG